MKITLNQAFIILEKAVAITININGYNAVIQPTLIDSDGEYYFMTFSFENTEGEIWEFCFYNKDNPFAELKGSVMTLKDQDGDDTEITLLAPWNVMKDIQDGKFDDDENFYSNEPDLEEPFNHTPGD